MFSVLDTIIRTYRRSPQRGPAADKASAVPNFVPGNEWRHFRIDAILGKGTFGTVYKAFDRNLHREVALKFLHSEEASREGRLLAGLEDPGIVKVHSFEESPNCAALCLQLVEGVDLEEYRRQHGNLTAEHAAIIVKHALHALATVHRKGLLHRDLKPANIVLGDSGRPLLVDFGLGTIWSQGDAEIAGTLPYMAPEILNGSPATVGSDLYSIGVILFYLVSGEYPTPGNSFDDFQRAHRTGQRNHLADRGFFHPTYVAVVEKALSQHSPHRFRSAGEMISALDEVFTSRRAGAHSWRAPLFVTLLTASIGIAGALYRWWPVQDAGVFESEQLVRGPGLAHTPSMSADGRVLVYSWDGGNNGDMDIWAKYPDDPAASRLTREGSHETQPSVSPDGTRVVYRSSREGGALYVRSILGGGERKLAVRGHNPRFSPDGTKIAYWTGLNGNNRFATGRIYIIPVAGGPTVRIAPDFADARYPTWSPDGKLLLFNGTKEYGRMPESASQWYLARADGTGDIESTNFAGVLQSSGLTPYASPPAWVGDRLFFASYRGEPSNIWSASVANGLRLTIGSLTQLTSGPAIEAEPQTIDTGTVVFATLDSKVNIWTSPLHSTAGGTMRRVTSTAFTVTAQPSVSRDGKYLAFQRKEGLKRFVYVKDLVTGEEMRLSPQNSFRPVVNPDGSRVAFAQKDGTEEPIWIYEIGTGALSKVCANCGMVQDWTPDGLGLVYSAGSRPILSLLDIRDRRVISLLESSAELLYDEFRFSPDGRHVAFARQSAEGQRQIVLAGWANGSLVDRNLWRVLDTSSTWDNNPRWTTDGNSIVFLSRRDSFGCIWRVRLNAEMEVVGVPTPLQHLHSASPGTEELTDISFQLAVGGNSVFYNVAELAGTIWRLTRAGQKDR